MNPFRFLTDVAVNTASLFVELFTVRDPLAGPPNAVEAAEEAREVLEPCRCGLPQPVDSCVWCAGVVDRDLFPEQSPPQVPPPCGGDSPLTARMNAAPTSELLHNSAYLIGLYTEDQPELVAELKDRSAQLEAAGD